MANAGEAVIGFALPTLPAIGAVEIAVGWASRSDAAVTDDDVVGWLLRSLDRRTLNE